MNIPFGLPRRAAISAAIAAAVAVVVTTLVMCFGVIPAPAFPPVTKHADPALTGYVAFQNTVRARASGVEPRVCVDVVPAAGGPRRRVYCFVGSEYGGRFRWTRDGRLAVATRLPGGRTETMLVDPRDGKVVQRLPDNSSTLFNSFEADAGRLERFETATEDRRAQVVRRSRDGAHTVLISVKAPESYRFRGAQPSPDGKHLLVTDSDDRILVARADGTQVRVLTTRHQSSYGSPQWFQPGRAEGTVTVDELVGRRPVR